MGGFAPGTRAAIDLVSRRITLLDQQRKRGRGKTIPPLRWYEFFLVCEDELNTDQHQENVKWEDFECPTTGKNSIPLRIYRSMSGTGKPEQPQPIYLWFHGGGFLFGTLATEDAFCARVAAVTQMIVVNVCYRHTPEWKWPAQAEDAYAAVAWVFDHLDMLGADHRKVIVSGVSAGSLLAVSSVIRYKRDQARPNKISWYKVQQLNPDTGKRSSKYLWTYSGYTPVGSYGQVPSAPDSGWEILARHE